jgi:Calcium-activated chloride channel
VRRDYARLASSIRTILITELLIGNVKEVVIPIYMAKRKKKAKAAEALTKLKAENPDLDESECVVDPRLVEDPIFDQLELEPYDDVFSDYFELVRQFSQITLFAAAFPLGALLALLNNFVEIYSDLYKLVNTRRRASPRRALNIGGWIRAFECISVISIITNLGIITVTANFADSVIGRGSSKTEEYFWMVVIEHALLASRFILMGTFEGIPSWVRDQRAKERYLAAKQLPTQQHSSSGSSLNDAAVAVAAATAPGGGRRHVVTS